MGETPPKEGVKCPIPLPEPLRKAGYKDLIDIFCLAGGVMFILFAWVIKDKWFDIDGADIGLSDGGIIAATLVGATAAGFPFLSEFWSKQKWAEIDNMRYLRGIVKVFAAWNMFLIMICHWGDFGDTSPLIGGVMGFVCLGLVGFSAVGEMIPDKMPFGRQPGWLE